MTSEEYVLNRLRMLDEEVLNLRDKNLEKVFKMNDLKGQIETATKIIENLLGIARDYYCYSPGERELFIKEANEYFSKYCRPKSSDGKKGDEPTEETDRKENEKCNSTN